MPIKQTVPTNSGDYLQFGNATTPVAAQVGGYEDSTGNGHLEWYTTSSGTVTERMRIDANGNVGIGTGSPAVKFHTAISTEAEICRFSTSINSYVYGTIRSSSVSAFIGGADASVGWSGTLSNHPYVIKTNDTERMRIDSSGNVGIGTSNPTQKLDVAGISQVSSSGVYLQSQVSGSDAFISMTGGGDLSFRLGSGYTQIMRLLSTGELKFNSGYGSIATAYGCRAWANFDGTTSPATIRASGNVTSITRNGTGDYTLNFTNSMPDANYSVTGTAETGAQALIVFPFQSSTNVENAPTSSSFRFWTGNRSAGSPINPVYCSIVVHR